MSNLTLAQRFAVMQFGRDKRLGFYRKLAKMLTQSVPVVRALEDFHERTLASAGKSAPLAIVLDAWLLDVRDGRPLGTAMSGWIPESERMIIAAAESGGHLENGLLSAVEIAANSGKIKGAIIGGLTYPGAVVAMAGGYLYIFGTKVIPEFSRIMDPTKWQGLAASLYQMSVFVQGGGVLYLVGGAVGLGVLVGVSMPLWRGRLRVMVEKIPPYSIYRMVVGGSFFVSFSALIGAGVTIEKALEKLREGASPWLAERIDAALLGIKSGSSFGKALREAGHDFPSRELVDDLIVYSGFSGFDKALDSLVREWMTEGVDQIAGVMKVVNTASIFALALVVVWLVGGFFGIQQELAALAQKGGQ